jgi:hypothetical protein
VSGGGGRSPQAAWARRPSGKESLVWWSCHTAVVLRLVQAARSGMDVWMRGCVGEWVSG